MEEDMKEASEFFRQMYIRSMLVVPWKTFQKPRRQIQYNHELYYSGTNPVEFRGHFKHGVFTWLASFHT